MSRSYFSALEPKRNQDFYLLKIQFMKFQLFKRKITKPLMSLEINVVLKLIKLQKEKGMNVIYHLNACARNNSLVKSNLKTFISDAI